MAKSVGYFEENAFAKYAGADPDAAGVIDVRVNVWALDYGNPEAKDNNGWGIFNAILGWTNVATFGTIISYCLYWAALAAYLVILGIHEKRVDRRQAITATKEETSSEEMDSSKLQPRVELVL
ncbi:high-affinity iron permease [Coemansia sp. RSA 1694]|nr:high-affinity iron permease [Coemansia sp. RSA 1694]